MPASSPSFKSSPSPSPPQQPPPSAPKHGGANSYSTAAINGQEISLTDLLLETELIQYDHALRTQLKIMRPEHLRDVHESDLTEIGMSKPEQRRLMKTYQKYFPSSLARKLKQKVLHRKPPQPSSLASSMTANVPGSSSWNNQADILASSSSNSQHILRRCNSNEEFVTATAADNGYPAMKDSRLIYAADDIETGDGDQHIIAASNIILCRQLGKGEFGTVWQGVWTTSAKHRHRNSGSQMKIQVAVKQIMSEKMQSSSMDFVREAAIMHRIHHENIVRFFGVVLETQTIMLVTELAPSRSLAECLKEDRSVERFSILQLCDFAQQICLGMSYLESNRFIHRDLAARNILVFSTHKVKISDFGLSRALGVGEEYYRSNFSVNLRLPIAWCAPECINLLKFTLASDCWAYAVTLWEMFTYGFQPWAGLNGQQIFDQVNEPKMARLECPDLCPQEFYNLMLKCWHHEPDQRPKFSEILSILPTIEPERVVTVKACRDGQLDHLQHGIDDVITVLDKWPSRYPDGYYWKGALKNGRTGLFLPANTVAYLESQRPGMPATAVNSVSSAIGHFNHHKNHHLTVQNSNQQHQNQHQQKSTGFIRNAIDSLGGLARKSGGKAGIIGAFSSKEKNGGTTRPLISLPQNDLRHTGHLGLDGECFGDVQADLQAHLCDMDILKNNLPRRTAASLQPTPIIPPKHLHHQSHQRFESHTSETACLLTPDDEYADENGHVHAAVNRGADLSTSTDLDDVRPMALGGDSGGSLSLLDEVFEALDQHRVTSNGSKSGPTATPISARMGSRAGGITNVAARFSTEEGGRTPMMNSVADDEDVDDELTADDRRRLFLPGATPTSKRPTDSYSRLEKEKTVKPLSNADIKMLNEIDKLADKLSTKALEKERDRLHEEKRKLGIIDDLGENGGHVERSPSPSSDRKKLLMRKLRRTSPNGGQTRPTFTDSLAMKCDGGERISPEAENAYKTLIEGKTTMSSSILLPREERDDPQRPSVEEDRGGSDDSSSSTTTEDETNPLRMLRNEGANVVRRFTRQGSGRRPQIEKPTPPVRRKNHQNDVNGQQNGCNSETNGFKSTSKLGAPPPPPPVPPRLSPKLDGNRNIGNRVPENSNGTVNSRPPAVPPKPKFVTASKFELERSDEVESGQRDFIRSASGSEMETRLGSNRSENGNGNLCPSFTLDDVNKYDLLSFVLSGLPDSKKFEDRQKLINAASNGTKDKSISSTNGKNYPESESNLTTTTTRNEISIDDDVVHV